MGERLNCKDTPRCLQEKIGSCLGCNVLTIVLEKRPQLTSDQERPFVDRVKQSLCPEGNNPLVPRRTVANVTW